LGAICAVLSALLCWQFQQFPCCHPGVVMLLMALPAVLVSIWADSFPQHLRNMLKIRSSVSLIGRLTLVRRQSGNAGLTRERQREEE
jgi:hypothetical protein